MTFLDFFSGIGGFRLALEMAGHVCLGHCEIDKYADRSYREMFEIKTNEWYANDITKVDPAELPEADMFVGGFPCQSFSIAGKGLGFNDTRGTLIFDVLRLAKARQPKILLLENVKRLITHDKGRTFATILNGLCELGYSVEWQVLNSKDHGVPQNRERVFIVASLGGKCTGKIFPVLGADGPDIKQIIGGTQGRRVYDSSGAAVTLTAEGGGKGGKSGLYTVAFNRKDGVTKEIDTAYAINASDTRGINRNQTQNAVFIDLCENARISENARCLLTRALGMTNRNESSGVLIPPDGAPCNEWELSQEKVIRAGNVNPSGRGMNGEVYATEGLAPTVTTNKGEGSKIIVPVLTPAREKIRQNGPRFKDPDQAMFTLTGQDVHGVAYVKNATRQGYDTAHEGDSINLAFPDSKERRGRVGKGVAQTLDTGCNQGVLQQEPGGVYIGDSPDWHKPPLPGLSRTIMAAKSAAGITDGFRIRKLTPLECWRLQGFPDELFYKAKAVNSDNQLYKQAGNSVTVNVVYVIAKRLKELEWMIFERKEK